MERGHSQWAKQLAKLSRSPLGKAGLAWAAQVGGGVCSATTTVGELACGTTPQPSPTVNTTARA